jgi:DNA gyrase subunit A
VVGMVVIKRDATLLVVTQKGLGKVTDISEYRVQKRGGKGILTLNRTEKTGNVVSIMEVLPQDEIMLITKHGVIIRSSVAEVRLTGRNAQGVKLVNLDGGDLLMAVARLVPDDKPDGEVPAGVDDGPDDEGDDGEDDE